MADNEIKVEISGQDTTQGAFQSILNSLNGLTSAATGAGSSISNAFEGVTSAIGKVSTAMMGIGALMAGGAMFSGSISKSNEFTSQVNSLAVALGMSYDKATTMNIALKEIGVSSEDYIGMVMKMDRQLKTHADLFDYFGVKTKDASGNLLDQQDVMQNALAVMMSYEAGTNRNLISMGFFGRSAQEAAKLIRLNAEVMEHATEIQHQLGLTIDKDGVESLHKYERANADVGLVFTAVSGIISKNVIPIIIDLGKFIIDNAAPAIYVLSKAIDILMLGFYAVAAACEIPIAAIKMLINAAIAAGTVIYDVLTGQWGKVANDAKAGLDMMSKNFGDMMNGMVDKAKKGMETIKDLMKAPGEKAGGGMPPGGHKELSQKDRDKLAGNKGTEEKPDKSQMAEWEEIRQEAYLKDLTANRVSNEEKLAADLDYWEKIKANLDKSAVEYDAVQKKITQLKIQQLTQQYAAEDRALAEEQAVNMIGEDREKQAAMSAIALKKEELQTLVALDKMSKAEELRQLKEFTDQEYQLELQAQSRKLMMQNEGTAAYALQYKQIEALMQKHELTMKQYTDKEVIENRAAWSQMMQPVTSAFSQGINGMISHTQSFRQSMHNIGQQIATDFINMVIKKIVNEWIVGELSKLNFSKTISSILVALGIETEQAKVVAKKTGAIEEKAIDTGSAETGVLANAVKAATGAASAVSNIPYVGPVLAIAAFAAVLALCIGSLGMLSSAEGGYDIPSGVNPMTQLHQNEMVLPADIANHIRSSMSSNSGGGGGALITMPRGAKLTDLITLGDHKKALQRLVRDGHLNAMFAR